jgi:hypothetical protein
MEGPPPTTLRARTGIAPKLIEGPRVGQQSLYKQRVLDVSHFSLNLSNAPFLPMTLRFVLSWDRQRSNEENEERGPDIHGTLTIWYF